MNDRSQGQRANDHGGDIEELVRQILLMNHFSRVDLNGSKCFHALDALRRAMDEHLFRPAGTFAQQVFLCQGIHETDIYADFLVYFPGWPTCLALECKHQYVSGSASAKTEYLYANIDERFPCPCLVLLEGPEFTPAIKRRGREWVQKTSGRVAGILDGLEGFRVWVRRGLPYPTHEATLL